MKKNVLFTVTICVLLLPVLLVHAQPQKSGAIRLIVRGDDIGMAHAVNQACIEAYKNGIMTTVEVMVPCPWFTEAAKLLRENPGLDVGIHLVLTSEWDNMKWRPLTCAPSLVNGEHNFYPTIWDVEGFPPNSNLLKTDWKIEEAEKELRAQIELALRKIPHISHLSDHMAFTRAAPALKQLVEKLAAEYGLALNLEERGVQYAGGFGGPQTTPEQKEAALLAILQKLTPGDWLFIDHPGYDVPELQGLGHKGYENVAADRAGVAYAFTSEKVKKLIEQRGIRLISYRQLKEEGEASGK